MSRAMRLCLVLTVACLLGLLVLTVTGRTGQRSNETRGTATPAPTADPVLSPAPTAGERAGPARALGVLRRWDEQRAAAYRRSDPAALRSLYEAGSAAAAADVRLLGDYTRRGLVVRGMHRQVLATEVLREDRGVLQMQVRDRPVAVRVGPVGRPASHRALPPGSVRSRVVTLIRAGASWQVRSVTAARPRPGS